MFIWEELEFNLGSRVKSVLIVALAAFLAVQQGMAAKEYPYEGMGAQTAASGNGIYEVCMKESNPIDEYFEGLAAQVKGPVEEISFANIYLDSWERELLRAYEVLCGASAGFPDYGKEYAGNAARQFAEFAETQGWLEAYFSSGSERAEEHLQGGVKTDALGRDKAFGKARLTRWLTLRIYGMLKEGGPERNEWDGRFVFEKDTAQQALRECGVF